MILIFSTRAWDEYLQYQNGDRRLLERVNALIQECMRHPSKGTGKPEPLKDNMRGWWSRRIDREHRLVYRVSGSGDAQALEIAQCRYHY
ncbi:MAG: Txe/YoeB family addiction module toxin [Novosphingobium sp.]|nr:Txe/YoeB family addiction module toxin [Novosphingobium sp.]MBX9644859.1 Txe/YoeB family addiction module toxin [Novosphingobium sp.]